MTIKPVKNSTWYLLLNKGRNNRKDYPKNTNGYKTASLWEEVNEITRFFFASIRKHTTKDYARLNSIPDGIVSMCLMTQSYNQKRSGIVL